jgi:hypothetical protein
VQTLKLHAAEAGGVLRVFVSWVVMKLRLHAAEAGGVLCVFVSWAVMKLRLHDAKACGVRLFSQLRACDLRSDYFSVSCSNSFK